MDLERVRVMGILNVTPDSFFDGGDYVDINDAVRHAYRLLESGADIIDVGGESTRPGSVPVSLDEELRRVVPVLEEIGDFGVPISIDTYKPEVAKRCLDLGVSIVNDVYALRRPGMAELVREYGAPVILMHLPCDPAVMKGNVYLNLFGEIESFFEERISYARSYGIEKIFLDPGFGFGKSPSENVSLLGSLDYLNKFGLPLAVGTSRKSFPKKDALSELDVLVRSLENGARILRVHDVSLGVEARKIYEKSSTFP